MSWWTKNRKKVLLGGLLAGTGGALVGAGPLAGLLGAGEAGAAGAAGALGAAQGAGAVGMVGPVASGVEYGALMGGSSPGIASAMGMADKGMGALSAMSKGMGVAQSMQPQQPPSPPPPPQQQPMQQPVNAGYPTQNMAPPPGVSPMQWEEMKRRMMAQGGMR